MGGGKVTGCDINADVIEFANNKLNTRFPHLKNKLSFECCDIKDLKQYDFDLILSKDAFEHIIPLKDVLNEIILRLKPDGKILIGFGPLYNSPYGDHRRTKSIIPWGHLIFSERTIVSRINKRANNRIKSIYDLGLNKYSLRYFDELLHSCGLRVDFYRVNASNNPFSLAFTLVSKIPFLREYFSHNVYCILSKDSEYMEQS